MTVLPPEPPKHYQEYPTSARAALAAALLAPATPLINLRRKWAPRTGRGDEVDVRAVPQEDT